MAWSGSWRDVGGWLDPGLSVSQHGIGDHHQLVHHRDQRDLLFFAALDQAAVKRAQRFVELNDREAGDVKRRPHLGPAAADLPPAAVLAAIAVDRRHADKRRDAMTIDSA